jgi:phage terminase large subunit-like protein
MPSREAAYRNLILNQRVNMVNPYVSRAVWEACAGEIDHSIFQNAECYIGLDLSARHDLTAMVKVAADAEGVFHVECQFFAPMQGVEERAQRDRVPYDVWAQRGLLTLTPGASVEYSYVADALIDECEKSSVVEVAFDRWRMDVLKSELMRKRVELPMVDFGQGFKDMAPALEALEELLLNGKIRHGGNPILRMCATNAIATRDPAGNRKLDKSKATGRIDGMVALAMAIGRAQHAVESNSIDQGFVVL